jgi:hypothetical protein
MSDLLDQLHAKENEIARLMTQNIALKAMVERYMSAYPAFRIKPVGAPNSEKRREQENLMALEDSARKLLGR